MGVDYDSIAGIGIELTEKVVEEFKLDSLWSYIQGREGDAEEAFQTYVKDKEMSLDNLYIAQGGNYFSGDYAYFLFAKEPIFGLTDYLSDLKTLGIDKTLNDISLLSCEVIW